MVFTTDLYEAAAVRHAQFYAQRLRALQRQFHQQKDQLKILTQLDAIWLQVQQAFKWAQEHSEVKIFALCADLVYEGELLLHLRLPQQEYVTWVEHGLEAARATHNTPQFIHLLRVLSIAYSLVGRYADAIAVSLQLLEQAELQGDLDLKARSLSSLGTTSIRLNDYASAESYLLAALNLAEQLQNGMGQAVVLNNLAVMLIDQGRYAVAHDYFKRSLALHRQLNNLHGVASSLNNLAQLNMFIGESDAALIFSEESLLLRQQLGDQFGLAHSLITRGQWATLTGDVAAANTHWQAALQIAEQQNLWRMKGEIWIEQGIMLWQRGELAAAYQHLEDGVAILQDIESKTVKGLLYLALIDLTLGDLAAARPKLAHALQLALQSHAAPLILLGIAAAALLYAQQGQGATSLQLARYVEAGSHPQPLYFQYDWQRIQAQIADRIGAVDIDNEPSQVIDMSVLARQLIAELLH